MAIYYDCIQAWSILKWLLMAVIKVEIAHILGKTLVSKDFLMTDVWA